MSKAKNEFVIVNKRAKFEYRIIDVYVAGIKLTGTEIKALREGKGNLKEAYCFFKKGELWVKNMNISEYSLGTHFNHEPKRLRKLLLRKRELKKLESKTKEKGFTIVPLKMFVGERGYVKVEIALATGKKTFDKRDSIKQKDLKRDLDRFSKYS